MLRHQLLYNGVMIAVQRCTSSSKRLNKAYLLHCIFCCFQKEHRDIFLNQLLTHTNVLYIIHNPWIMNCSFWTFRPKWLFISVAVHCSIVFKSIFLADLLFLKGPCRNLAKWIIITLYTIYNPEIYKYIYIITIYRLLPVSAFYLCHLF